MPSSILGNGAPSLDEVDQSNLEAAKSDLKLTPEETALYERHLTNLYGPGGVDNANGSRSTLLQTNAEIEGKTYNLPTVYNGKILPPKEAVQKAIKEGLDRFPSYPSEDEAERRYSAMHDYMEKDTKAFLASRAPNQGSAVLKGGK